VSVKFTNIFILRLIEAVSTFPMAHLWHQRLKSRSSSTGDNRAYYVKANVPVLNWAPSHGSIRRSEDVTSTHSLARHHTTSTQLHAMALCPLNGRLGGSHNWCEKNLVHLSGESNHDFSVVKPLTQSPTERAIPTPGRTVR